MTAQQLVTDGGYSKEKIFQYNNIAGFFWGMGEEDRHEIAAVFIRDNPDFLEFWKMYTFLAVARDCKSSLPSNSSVYFLKDDVTGNVKVGVTKGCPIKRTNQIKGMNHTPLTLLFALETGKGCEGALHRLLKPFNVHHEWFVGAAAKAVIPLLTPFKDRGDIPTVADIEGFAESIGKTVIPAPLMIEQKESTT